MLKEFKKPDLKAPRCRAEVHRLVDKGFMREFAEQHPVIKGLASKDVNKILKVYHEMLWNHIVSTRDGVELPEQLGYIFVGTCNSPKKFNVDYGNSIKDELAYRHRNFESDNYLAKIFYTNFSSKYRFKNRNLWMFEATRLFKRSVAKKYPENWKIYIQVENGRNISKYLKRSIIKDLIKKASNKPVAQTYNEFDMS